MKLPKLREIKEAVKSLLSKPFTTKFPYEPHIPSSSFRGKPEFFEDKCVGCCACVNVCPTGALSFKDVKKEGGYKRILKIRWDVCIECGQCQYYCLTQEGIKLTQEYDLSLLENRKSFYQTIEKELVTCEICGKPFACSEHIEWIVKKLGSIYVSNTSLIAFIQHKLGIKDSILKTKKDIFRQDRFRLICPACRRKVGSIS